MSALFFKRFLQKPFQIASIIPSSKALVERVASKINFSRPRTIAEFGPGEGVHSRELAARMDADSQLFLFELDPELANHLRHQFRDDGRISVINDDAHFASGANSLFRGRKQGLLHRRDEDVTVDAFFAFPKFQNS